MNDLQARLLRLSADIAQIEQELKSAAEDSRGPVIEIFNEEALSAAKSALDRLRQMLWAHLQAAARQTTRVDEMIEHYRMERVTNLLHDFSGGTTAPRLASLPEAQSLFSSIQEIAATAVEKHLERGTRRPVVRPMSRPNGKTYLN